MGNSFNRHPINIQEGILCFVFLLFATAVFHEPYLAHIKQLQTYEKLWIRQFVNPCEHINWIEYPNYSL